MGRLVGWESHSQKRMALEEMPLEEHLLAEERLLVVLLAVLAVAVAAAALVNADYESLLEEPSAHYCSAWEC